MIPAAIEKIHHQQESHEHHVVDQKEEAAKSQGEGMALAGIVHVKVVKATDLINVENVTGIGLVESITSQMV